VSYRSQYIFAIEKRALTQKETKHIRKSKFSAAQSTSSLLQKLRRAIRRAAAVAWQAHKSAKQVSSDSTLAERFEA